MFYQSFVLITSSSVFPSNEAVITKVISSTKKVSPARVVATFESEAIINSSKKWLRDWKFGDQTNLVLLGKFWFLALDSPRRRIGLVEAVEGLLEEVGEPKILVGDEVMVEATPFGHRSLCNSHSQGIVSNVFGEKGCLVLTDAPAAPGCEGGVVYLKSR